MNNGMKIFIAMMTLVVIMSVIGLVIYFVVDDNKSDTVVNNSTGSTNKIDKTINSTVRERSNSETTSSVVYNSKSSTSMGVGSSTLMDVGSSTSNLPIDNNSKTVREKLVETCPVDPSAGDKINLGNGATRNEYLFSACTADNTCDSTNEPDEMSKRIINMKKPQEHCGAWVLNQDPNQIQIVYNNNTKTWNKLNNSKTVREKLVETCPVDPSAGDKIYPGNAAKYNDYLFSACTADNTCDSTEDPDPVSKRIINMKKPQEHCGAWVLNQDPNQIQIVYNNNTKTWIPI